jgi:2-keto-4-pentenoate hydratase/2-oxohepta-3-ene-1,7-dioic acid hydratase in catechol pathway
MRIGRVGEFGIERPVVFEGDELIYVDSIIKDWDRAELEAGAREKVAASDLSNLPRGSRELSRIGSPVARPSKMICVGLNYLKHIAETNNPTPTEPVIFMKAPDTLVGPDDGIVIPPGSKKSDYEVELAVIIGKRALYLKDASESRAHILGVTISQDVSEREWQLERSGQWVKGKSFPTFNPMGPEIVTLDQIDFTDLHIWCEVDGEMRQNSRTSDLLYGIDHLVWYISQFMELFPGDIINTGTPSGVGMGHSPTKYLVGGEVVRSGIEGIGIISSVVSKYLP